MENRINILSAKYISYVIMPTWSKMKYLPYSAIGKIGKAFKKNSFPGNRTQNLSGTHANRTC
jgi:hypothetical protein